MKMIQVKGREAAPSGARERESIHVFRTWFFTISPAYQIARDVRRGSSVAERTHEALAL